MFQRIVTPVLSKRFGQSAAAHAHTAGIKRFLRHPAFPVDIRHNAKIGREKLAAWATHQLGSNA